jgi:3-dehydroquinate synthetase
MLAFGFSVRRGLAPQADYERVVRHLADAGLPTSLSAVPSQLLGADRLMDLIAQDKKVKRGQLTFILVNGIGQGFIARDVDPGEVRAFLSEKLAER